MILNLRAFDKDVMHGPIGMLHSDFPEFIAGLSCEADIMMSTGLKDKNGNEIFRLDVVKTGSDVLPEDQGKYLVDWRDGYTGFYLFYIDEIGNIETEWHCLLNRDEVDALCLEIIGHKYEPKPSH